jgi:hypothetical protein
MGFWIIGFIDRLHIVTTNNCNTIANSHTLRITAANPSHFAFTSRFQVTDLNNGDSSASMLTSVLSGEFPAT